MTECQWIGKGERCTEVAVEGRSYCKDHIWLVYQKGTHLSKRKKDIRVASNVHMLEDLLNQAIEELELEGEI